MNTRCPRGHAEGLQNPDYVKGEVQGYLAPWWRVAYSDESWGDLTATELRKGIQLRMLMGHRELRPSLVDPSTGRCGMDWTVDQPGLGRQALATPEV